MIQEVTINFMAGLVFVVAGCVMVWIPNQIFRLILIASILVSFSNGCILLIRYIRGRTKGTPIFIVGSFALCLFLMQNKYLPQWIIRTGFGLYLIVYGTSCLIQLIINFLNTIDGKFSYFVIALFSYILGLYLLLTFNFNTKFLMQSFGIYTIMLGIRYVSDGLLGISPHTKYRWKRKFRISLPAILCAFVPDWTLNTINRYLDSDRSVTWVDKKTEENAVLRVMVHIGPKGFQKVGHISFVYDDIVYSYGNYDEDSIRLNGAMGDGVFFTVPYLYYLPMIMKSEKNSIFEYGIHINEEQKGLIEKEIRKLENHSYRWLSRIESENGYDRFESYQEDYPSRLHLCTGAKFYKFKSGRFKIYWALGDNCALFTDIILGKLGADVLSMRGIVSPGTYLDWLQHEYLKKNSPIISRTIHSLEI